MPDWMGMKKTYAIGPEHLPNPNGPNVAVIEGIDTEEAVDPQTKQPYERHVLYLVGWRVPLRLNNALIDTLTNLFGPRTEDAVGKRIVLLVGVKSSFGETKPCINIHPFAPDQSAPPAQPPLRLMVTSGPRKSLADSAFRQLPPAASGTAPPSPLRDTRPIGKVGADRLMARLAEFKQPYDAFLLWCKRHDPEAYQAAWGEEIEALPAHILKTAKRYFDHLADAKSPGTQPSATEAAKSGTEIDRVTGEVIDPTSIRGVQRGVGGLKGPELDPVKAAANASAPIDDEDIPF